MKRLATGLIALALIGACDGEDPLTPEETLVGTWALVSVDERVLPFEDRFTNQSGASCAYTFATMELTFGNDLHFNSVAKSFGGCAGVVENSTESNAGGYRTDGNRLFLKYDNSPPGAEGELEYTFSSRNSLTLKDYSLGFATTRFELKRVRAR